ncbi:MAG: alpha/beta fold hydrolase [Solirubrobacterales bacterium]
MDRPDGIVEFTPDPDLYPFESRWFESSVGPLHYVDEGDGTPLLLLHGNPDWSFLYRKFIVALGDEFRCVAPDYPGFGLSVHPEGYGYTAAEHAVVVAELIDELELDSFVVVGADWGGPIGLEIATQQPDRVGGFVMGNTWCWPVASEAQREFANFMRSDEIQRAIHEDNYFVTEKMAKQLQAELSPEEFRHYTDVVPTPKSREGIAVFPREILDAEEWLVAILERIPNTVAGKPMVLTFGREDPSLGAEVVIERWQSLFPSSTFVDLPGASHYIQEDAPEAMIAAIRDAFG